MTQITRQNFFKKMLGLSFKLQSKMCNFAPEWHYKLDNKLKLMPQGNKSDVLFHIITKPKLHLPTYNSEIKHVI